MCEFFFYPEILICKLDFHIFFTLLEKRSQINFSRQDDYNVGNCYFFTKLRIYAIIGKAILDKENSKISSIVVKRHLILS